MKHKVLPHHQENLQDLDGNTALHLFANPDPLRIPPPQLPPSMRFEMAKILLDWKVSPLVRNAEGRMAVECVEKEHKPLRDLLEKATKKGEW